MVGSPDARLPVGEGERIEQRHKAGRDLLPYVYLVTKYDPDERDQNGSYIGAEDAVSDHGPVEAAYLEAVAAFAADACVEQLTIREPQVAGFMHFGLVPAVEGYGLAGIFPPDFTGFHDGAQVPVAVGLKLVRAMVREGGAWCRLEAEGVFWVHVGWDQYVYVGAGRPCNRALSRTRDLGLFPEQLGVSPYDAAFDDEPGEQRPADDTFWARLLWFIAKHEAVVLEETHIQGVSRWHRLTSETVDTVRAELHPRAQLTVWPDLSTDVDGVLATLPNEGSIEFVWEDSLGHITSAIVDETQFTELAAKINGARAAAMLSIYVDERDPLFTAVLPDSDGVVRARWRTDRTSSDHHWEILKTLHPSETCGPPGQAHIQ